MNLGTESIIRACFDCSASISGWPATIALIGCCGVLTIGYCYCHTHSAN